MTRTADISRRKRPLPCIGSVTSAPPDVPCRLLEHPPSAVTAYAAPSAVEKKLAELDLDRLAPIDAVLALRELRALLGE